MAEERNERIQELFLAALETPLEQRDAWLVEQCDDEELLREVRSLLEHDTPDDDPLEKPLDEVLDLPNTVISSARPDDGLSDGDVTQVDSEHFISRLSEVGVLSPEEIETLNQTVASGHGSANARQIAAQLVSQGKLTGYQASALLAGQPELLIDKYLILDLLDAGGMGMVFKAIHRPMNRTVAVKMIAQHLLASPEQVKRFQREVRVAATLEHPNIVRSYDADQSRGIHFLVMEYVRGENLAKIVHRQGPLTVEMAVDCVRQAAKGLRYAQKKGVIHRDIKPGNLMLGDEGIVKVLDLGLAHIDESFRLVQQSSITGDQESHTAQSLAGSELTTAGAVLGTVSFMAPEQSLDARKADTRADIYSLGCTLYYLLVGEAPYRGDTIFQVFMLHREGEIPAIHDKRPDVPENVEAVCQKMLAKKPKDRYQSMGELLEAIEECGIAPPPEKVARSVSKGQSDPGIPTPSGSRLGSTVSMASQGAQQQTTSPGESPSLSRRVTIALALLLALGGGYWWWQNNTNQDDPKQTQVADTTPTDNGDTNPGTQLVDVTPPQYALEFDGIDDRVEIPSLKLDGTQTATLEATVRLYSEPTPSAGKPGVMSVISTDGRWINRTFAQNWLAGVRSGEDQSLHPESSTEDVVHLALVYDLKTVTLFVNGTKSSRKRWRQDGPVDSGIHPLDSGGSTWIGSSEHNLLHFHGTIDEVRFSNVARYTEDFTPADRFEADADTLALYHFDEGEGDVLTDSSGNNHHGRIVGAQWVRVYDEANMSAADLLATGEYQWQIVEELPDPINSDFGENSADMTADGLTIVFSSERREGSYGGYDLWMSTRASTDEPWDTPVNLGDLINSDDDEIEPALSPDGLTLSFDRNSDKQPYLVTTRDSLDSPWKEPMPGEFRANIPPDMNPGSLGFAIIRGTQSEAGEWHKDVGVSKRSSPSAPWPNPIEVTGPVNSEANEASAALTEDGRLLLFTRKETGQPENLWMSTRNDWDSAWSSPVRIETLNSQGSESNVRLLPDGKTILFSSSPEGAFRKGTLYLARLVRKPTTAAVTRSVSEGPGASTSAYDWQVIEKLPEPINSEYYESTADMTADGLTIVFGSNRPSG